MTSEEKSQALRLFLQNFDLSSFHKVSADPLHFMYTEGSNEGGYMVIGGYEYRCHACDAQAYLSAVAFYISLV